MSYLFAFIFIMMGMVGLVFGKCIYDVLGCFAVAALFDIAGALSTIAGRMNK